MRHLICLFGFVAFALVTFASSAESQGKKKKTKAPIWSDAKDAFGDPLPIGAIARIGTLRYRTAERRSPFQPALSPDAKWMAVPGNIDEIDIMELPAWKKLRTIKVRDIDKKDPAQFQGAVFTADGKKLLAYDMNRPRACLIEVATGRVLTKVDIPQKQGNPGGGTAILSRDEKTLVYSARSARGNSQVTEFIVQDLTKGKHITFELPMTRFDVQAMAPPISADGRWLAHSSGIENVGRPDRFESFIEIIDLTTGKTAHKIESEAPMLHTALSPDGKWLAASNGQSVLRIYDVATGKEKHNIRMRRSNTTHLAFSPDSTELYLADNVGSIQRFDPVRGERLGETKTPLPFVQVRQIAFDEKGKALAFAISIDAIYVWEIATGKMWSPVGLPAGMIDCVTFSPNGELFVAAEDGHAAWWDPRKATKLRDVKLEFSDHIGDHLYDDGLPFGRPNPGRRSIGEMLTMSASGDVIAVGEGSGLAVYDVKTGKLLYDEDSRTGQIQFSFFDGGQKIAAIQQKKVRYFGGRSGRDVAQFDLPLRNQESALRMVVADSGKYLAVTTTSDQPGAGLNGRTFLWDVAKKQVAHEWMHEGSEAALRFSADGQWLALASGPSKVRLLRTDKPRGDFPLELNKKSDEVSQVEFSPDGRQLACAFIVPTRNGGDAGKLSIYEVASKKVRFDLVGHPAGIIDRMAFAHDGALLATGASDTTVLIWNAGLHAFPAKAPPKEATAEELEARFTTLAGTDARKAFQDMIKLMHTPAQTVALLSEKIKPAEIRNSGEKTVPQWIRDLASGQFVVRNKANVALIKIGPSVEPQLREALKSAEDIETKRRIEALLDQFAIYEWSVEEVRNSRAVELLEAIASKDARAALSRWADGDAGAILTIESKAALARLK